MLLEGAVDEAVMAAAALDRDALAHAFKERYEAER